MQLREARLCLNCEEVHDSHACPACASENFTYMTRWVPTGQHQKPERPVKTARPARTAQRVMFGSAVLGVAAFYLGRWSNRARAKIEEAHARSGMKVMVPMIQFGTLPDALVRKSVELFAKEVMPSVRGLGEAAGAVRSAAE